MMLSKHINESAVNKCFASVLLMGAFWNRQATERNAEESSMNADVKRWFNKIVANDDNYYQDYALAA